MTNKKPLASDATVKAQLASLTLKTEALTQELETKTAENQVLRKQNVELASVIENDLKAESKLRIMAASDYKEEELTNLPIEQLQQIEATLNKSKGDAALAYKSIRASADIAHANNLTVGSLYGKSRKEILESGGAF
jgi:hypothetical protein